MSIASRLQDLLRSGVRRMGEIQIQSDVSNYRYVLSHWRDMEMASEPGFGSLTIYTDPESAREISTYAEDGSYRFTKGQVNLRRGWVMPLKDAEELRLALDLFYPACLGLHLAHLSGSLEVQHLRHKLERQTGMYRFARTISDAGAQKLVREVCGPANQCAKRILWRIDEQTELEDSEASRYAGIPGDLPTSQAIPLLCREACNHFVAECRKVAKAEYDAKSA